MCQASFAPSTSGVTPLARKVSTAVIISSQVVGMATPYSSNSSWLQNSTPAHCFSGRP